MARGRWGGGSGFGDALRRGFGEGASFFSFALTLFTLWGIRVRLHLVFILYLVFEALGTLIPDRPGIELVGPLLVALFVLVLLHEFGHCLACRWVGGEADEIVMWPLGGLAMCRPPHDWRANLITTVGGPAVNAVIFPITTAVIWVLAGSPASAFFWPFSEGAVSNANFEFQEASGLPSLLAYSIFAVHLANATLLLFNVLLPMYPMDGGRILHAVVWSRTDDATGRRVAATVGIVCAVVLALFAMTIARDGSGGVTLIAIAFFCGLSSYMELRQLREEGGPLYGPGVGYAAPEFQAAQPSKRDLKREAREREEAEAREAELDRILEKISVSGMGSLTRAEKKFLEKASDKNRRG